MRSVNPSEPINHDGLLKGSSNILLLCVRLCVQQQGDTLSKGYAACADLYTAIVTHGGRNGQSHISNLSVSSHMLWNCWYEFQEDTTWLFFYLLSSTKTWPRLLPDIPINSNHVDKGRSNHFQQKWPINVRPSCSSHLTFDMWGQALVSHYESECGPANLHQLPPPPGLV